MTRFLLIVLLSLGTIAGFSAGFMHLHYGYGCGREAFERHLAQLCVEAARSAPSQAPAAPRAPPTAPAP